MNEVESDLREAIRVIDQLLEVIEELALDEDVCEVLYTYDSNGEHPEPDPKWTAQALHGAGKLLMRTYEFRDKSISPRPPS